MVSLVARHSPLPITCPMVSNEKLGRGGGLSTKLRVGSCLWSCLSGVKLAAQAQCPGSNSKQQSVFSSLIASYTIESAFTFTVISVCVVCRVK